ncbi:VanZ family protein [Desulfosarcina sp.]|uniref:VanZ family protein n=1 Tax=Desulfosarcina sp. TaxID=2027861 RepID=UPI0035650248
MKTAQRTFFLYWLPVIALCAAIFVQSSFPPPDLGLPFPLKDKVMHMVAYGLLAVLFFRACRLTWPDRLSPMQLMAISVLFASLYGLSDEFHQSFVVARQADALDGVADVAGSILGALGYMWVVSRRGFNPYDR